VREPRLIDGHDIMETFSLGPGPRIGVLLELVREAEGSGEIGSRDEAIQLVKSKLRSGGGGA
jgi:poly(A) polymerase